MHRCSCLNITCWPKHCHIALFESYPALMQPGKEEAETSTKSAHRHRETVQKDNLVDLTDSPASQPRKRDSEGNPKIAGKHRICLLAIGMSVTSWALWLGFCCQEEWADMVLVVLPKLQVHQHARGSCFPRKLLSHPGSPQQQQGRMRTLLVVMWRT